MKIKLKFVNFSGIKGLALVDSSVVSKTSLIGGKLLIGIGLYTKHKPLSANTITYRLIKVGRLSVEWEK